MPIATATIVIRAGCFCRKRNHSGLKIPTTNRATERKIIALKIINNNAFIGCTSYLLLREDLGSATVSTVTRTEAVPSASASHEGLSTLHLLQRDQTYCPSLRASSDPRSSTFSLEGGLLAQRHNRHAISAFCAITWAGTGNIGGIF